MNIFFFESAVSPTIEAKNANLHAAQENILTARNPRRIHHPSCLSLECNSENQVPVYGTLILSRRGGVPRQKLTDTNDHRENALLAIVASRSMRWSHVRTSCACKMGF